MTEKVNETLPLFELAGTPLLIVMDGHAMVHRSFHAISVRGSLTVKATGEDITGVYGFTNVFLRALQDWSPTYCAIAFDTSAPTFRHLRFPNYKAQRAPTPPELRGQFGRVKQLMQSFGVPVFEVDGYEADDVIGTLCRQATAQGVDTVILTGDRDTFQLVSPSVRVDLSYSVQERKVYNEAELATRYSGLTAAQQPDFKALLGDTSDNIPGVPRIGEKRAIGLLTEFQNLEGIYQHLEEVKPPSVKASLAENRELAFANRELMTINLDAPVELDLEASRFGNYDRKALVDLMTELEFFSIIDRLPVTAGAGDSPMTADAPRPEPAPLGDYQAVRTEEELERMLAALWEAGSFSFDTETTSLDPFQADLVGLSFSVEPGKAWYVPVGHKEGSQLPLEHVLAAVRPLMESPDLGKCAHNANYDVSVLANHGVHCRNVDFDTMIAAHLLTKGALGLKNLALNVLGEEMTPITKLIGTGRKQITFDQVDIESAVPYAAADADMTGRLRDILSGQLDDLGLRPLLEELEMPLVPVLVNMQSHGIKVDAGALHEMSRDLNQQMQQVEQALYDSIGHTVNINSPQQLSDLLFKELGLPRTKRTKTGYSTDANSLDGLKGLHPVVDTILEYRQ
ncbi:MAG: DNA polymerase I, partial [Chloroflexi bacterium]|nr:DNA polymerase I [Chloroflexota bacterium]